MNNARIYFSKSAQLIPLYARPRSKPLQLSCPGQVLRLFTFACGVLHACTICAIAIMIQKRPLMTPDAKDFVMQRHARTEKTQAFSALLFVPTRQNDNQGGNSVAAMHRPHREIENDLIRTLGNTAR